MTSLRFLSSAQSRSLITALVSIRFNRSEKALCTCICSPFLCQENSCSSVEFLGTEQERDRFAPGWRATLPNPRISGVESTLSSLVPLQRTCQCQTATTNYIFSYIYYTRTPSNGGYVYMYIHTLYIMHISPLY